MAKLNFRYRKTFPILGKMLHWTVSKKGISLNFHLGPLSRSWGTRGNTTTIDAPGHFGFFWRKQEARSHKRQPEFVEQYAHTQARHRFWRILITLLLVIQIIAEFARANLHLQQCHITGHPNITLLVMIILEVGLIIFMWSALARVRNVVGLLIVCLVIYFHWKLTGSATSGDIHCHR